MQLADLLPGPAVLVIDDFQVITDGAVLGMVGRLFTELPPLPLLRLVLIGRADPVLPLHHLRVDGQLTEIRASDLAFTAAEIAELFTLNNMDVRADQVHLLRERTGGWPAGLRAVAIPVDPARVDAGTNGYRSDELAVVDVFHGAVIRAVPAADLDFMVKTSVVDILTGDLADQITGRADGRSTLQGLVRRNLFTVERGVPGWFSYQPLLRELLGHLRTLQRSASAADQPVTAAPPATPPDGPLTTNQEPASSVPLLPLPDGTMTVLSESDARIIENLTSRLTARVPRRPG